MIYFIQFMTTFWDSVGNCAICKSTTNSAHSFLFVKDIKKTQCKTKCDLYLLKVMVAKLQHLARTMGTQTIYETKLCGLNSFMKNNNHTRPERTKYQNRLQYLQKCDLLLTHYLLHHLMCIRVFVHSYSITDLPVFITGYKIASLKTDHHYLLHKQDYILLSYYICYNCKCIYIILYQLCPRVAEVTTGNDAIIVIC